MSSNKSKLKLLPILVIISCLLMNTLSSCSAQEVKIDTEALASDLLSNVSFANELTLVEESKADLVLPDMENCSVLLYMGEGTYADEILIVTASDKTSSDAAYNAVKSHKEDLKTSFENYYPAESEKVENSVLVQSGNYVVLCITDDVDTANSIISKYFN